MNTLNSLPKRVITNICATISALRPSFLFSLLLIWTVVTARAQEIDKSASFKEKFNHPRLKNFSYISDGRPDAFKYQVGANSKVEPHTKVLLLRSDSADSAGPDQGPALISKKFTSFGSYSARLKIPDVRAIQPNVGEVVGYFTYQMDSVAGLSEIDIEFLVADPTVIYIGTWTGFDGKLQRVGRAINLAKGIIYNTISKVNADGASSDLTGQQNQPATLPVIQGFDASARFYTYGFDWYPDRLIWWMIDPTSHKKLILWDYQGSKLGIPTSPTKYRLNFWHTSNWPVETNKQAVESPRHVYELEADWMKYQPFQLK